MLESNPFRFLRSIGRTREIISVLIAYGFDDLVDRTGLRRSMQWGKRLFFWKKQPPPEVHMTRARRMRLALESLGATFIKFGQVASTRPDLIPLDVIEEFTFLQEGVASFPGEKAVAHLEEQFGLPINTLYKRFDIEPLAAASLAQVHRAQLHDGTEVVVKIRRPNVVREVERDLALMTELAILIERHIPEAEIFDPTGLVNYFSRVIRRELNFAREARSTDEFARLFRNDPTLCVPRIYWDLTCNSVITMTYIDGLWIDEVEQMRAAGVSPRSVAANGARIYMKQAFEMGLFHGDPHPGNLRVLRNGVICLLDFGMVGMLEDEKREQLIDLFVAIVQHDVPQVVELMQEIGRPHRAIDIPMLRADVRDFVDNYYGVPLEQLDVANMLRDFVSMLSNHGIRCPSDLMLLIRALVTLEGVGRTLDPEFNIAEHLAPFVERLVKERYSPQRIADRVWSETRALAKLAHRTPQRLSNLLEKINNDELKLKLDHRGLDRLITELDRSGNRVVVALVMSSSIVAAALIIRVGSDAMWFSIPMYVLSSLLGVWLIYGIFRSGRL